MNPSEKSARGANDGNAGSTASNVMPMSQSEREKPAHVARSHPHAARVRRRPATASAAVATRTSATATHCAAVQGRASAKV